MEKGICIIGAGKSDSLEIEIKKTMMMDGEVFIRFDSVGGNIIKPSRIMKPDRKKEITIMKSVQCGMTTAMFDNWDLSSDWRSDLKERNLKNIRNQFVPEYVKKSLREMKL